MITKAKFDKINTIVITYKIDVRLNNKSLYFALGGAACALFFLQVRCFIEIKGVTRWMTIF